MATLYWAVAAVAVTFTYLLLQFKRKKKRRSVAAGVRLDGKTVVVTGSSRGMGLETAREMASRGARVIMASKDPASLEAAVEQVRISSNNWHVYPMLLDLSSFESIRQFVVEFKKKESRLDVLINNAGVFFIPHAITKDGFEVVFQVNHLGHFLLTLLLLDILKRSSPSRIINVSSYGHNICKDVCFDDINGLTEYNKMFAYAQSKLAQIFFTRALAKKLTGTGVTVNSVHPGCAVDTSIFKNYPLLSHPLLYPLHFVIRTMFFKSAADGAQTCIYGALAPELEQISGKYFSNCEEDIVSSLATDDALADKMWEFSLRAVRVDDIERSLSGHDDE